MSSSNSMTYWPFTVLRSDGCNNPPPEQSDEPNEKGQVISFVQQELIDQASIQWRVKLGKGVADECRSGPNYDPRRLFILDNFPRNYVLWKQVRENSSNPKDSRQDNYLYGHPGGRRFRSPNQFLPHLLWLLKGIEGAECTCEICSGVDRKERKKQSAEDDAEPIQESSAVEKGRATFTTAQPVAPNREQECDSEPNGRFLYRLGEMVWFHKNTAWGIGIICNRQLSNSKAKYLLQPLSYPSHNPPTHVKDEDAIRPWLAWTLPPPTHPQLANLLYDEVPWERVLQGEFGTGGDTEVDASILGAKAVEVGYTFFDQLPSPAGAIFYSGMFLGAEKLWVGDAVRLRLPDIVVLVIRQIGERDMGFQGMIPEIIGDVYEFVEIPVQSVTGVQWAIAQGLPARMAADLLFRREVAVKANQGLWCEWKLVRKNEHKGLNDILGRWYETRTMMPVLRGAEYYRDLERGLTSDVTKWMNRRGEGRNQRMKDRIECFGRAVPSGLTISRGLNGPPMEAIFPMEPQYPSQATDNGGQVEQDLDQFMNLDNMAEHMTDQTFYDNAVQK